MGWYVRVADACTTRCWAASSALTTMSSFRASHRATTDTAIALTTLLNIPTPPASCSAMEIYCGYEGDEIGEYIVDKIYGK